MADRRSEIIACNVRDAAEGTPLAALAYAADTDPEALAERLTGRDELNVADLIGVGGFLRTHPSDFLKGATQ